MIAVPITKVLALLEPTKDKTGAQIEIERELKALLDKRKIQSLTEPELEALFEEAAQEVALRTVVTGMRKAGKIETLHPVKH